MEESMLHCGRYERDFEEILKIGKGGGGKVIKVRHRLDNQIYAVKKIKIKSTDNLSIEQICREVKTLAEVSNSSCPSIVRYHTAWFESTDEADSEPSSQESVSTSEDDSPVQTNWSNGSGELKFSPLEPTPKIVEMVHSNDSQDEIVFEGSQDADNASQMRYMLYIQMELCGQPLSEWLEGRNKDGQPAVSKKQNLDILRQLLEGLHSLHQKDIIHRDLKPSNIFVTSHEPHVKIGDFGFSRKIICREEKDDELSSDVGTALYMAPEVKDGNDYDTKADMFSLGILLCELFSPFTTECERCMTILQLRETQCVTLEFRERWPDMADLIEQLIREDTTQRPNASQLLDIPEHKQLRPGDVVIERLTSQIENLTSKFKQLKGSVQKQFLASARAYNDGGPADCGDTADKKYVDDKDYGSYDKKEDNKNSEGKDDTDLKDIEDKENHVGHEDNEFIEIDEMA
ncbi:Eukaryotic translation initiation factor 2-alpha kinase 1 [Holothuria leucospilota]|uniref:non-specific serine/threonine protein kinase n=1 Tax=Holothuria leucospilota TaxID=206669 RepID=A0A9Q1BXY7_HOLLE|nr:Eukaryotic translation initiation factor 2-alpha kinase 1 [Holothuria leucospilota]